MEILDIILIVPGLIFLAWGLWGLKQGKMGPPLLIAAMMGKEWGFTYRKNENEEGYWASIAAALIIAFVWFAIIIAYLYDKYTHQ